MPLVHHILFETSGRIPEEPAVSGSRRTLSYRELLRRVNSLSAVLIVEGMQKGDRIPVFLRDRMDALVAMFAVARAGGIAVPVSPESESGTLPRVIGESVPAAIVTSHKDFAAIPDWPANLHCQLFHVDDVLSSQLIRSASRVEITPDQRPDATDPMTMLMGISDEDPAFLLPAVDPDTGTVRRESLVITSHRHLIRSAYRASNMSANASGERELISLDYCSTVGMTRIAARLLSGGTVVLPDPVSGVPESLLYGITAGCTVASICAADALRLLSENRRSAGKLAGHLRFLDVHGAGMTVSEKRGLADLIPGTRIRVFYDTPFVPFISMLDISGDGERPDTVGVPHVPVSIQNDEGIPAGAFESGELVIGREFAASGYWIGMKNRTHQADSEEWQRTGQAGMLDSGGYLRILGPLDEKLSIGGTNISCREIEKAIRTVIPGIDICVVGITDPLGIVGDIPVLCYVPNNGHSVNLSELSAMLADKLDRYHIPRLLFRMARLPQALHGTDRYLCKQYVLSAMTESTSQEERL